MYAAVITIVLLVILAILLIFYVVNMLSIEAYMCYFFAGAAIVFYLLVVGFSYWSCRCGDYTKLNVLLAFLVIVYIIPLFWVWKYHSTKSSPN
jgi:hypothetical protein